MSKWDNIPNEILKKIAKELSHHRAYTGWRHVNKQWLNMYQWTHYRNIDAGLEPDYTWKRMLSSPCQASLCVRELTIRNPLVAELDRYADVNFNETLRCWMSRCPNIKLLNLDTMYNDDWLQFEYLLSTNGVWKELQYLEPPAANWKYVKSLDPQYTKPRSPNIRRYPNPYRKIDLHRYRKIDPDDYKIIDEATVHASYFNCALYCRNTLEVVSLIPGIFNPESCEILQEFKSLKTLVIDNRILHNRDECRIIFQNLPYFTALTIRFASIMRYSVEEENKKFDSNIFSNIRKLRVISFVPTCDQDFLQFIKDFHGIKELAMIHGVDNNAVFWPLKERISAPVLESFFDFIHQIPSASISFSVNSRWFLIEYFKYLDHILKQDQISKIKVSFYELYGVVDKAAISVEENQLELTITFGYVTSRNGTSICIPVNNAVEDMIIHCNGPNTSVGEMLNNIISNCKSLHNLTFIEGGFNHYSSTPGCQHSIENLVFDRTRFSADALLTISTSFPYLKSLHFNNCPYQASNFILPDTAVDLLRVTYCHDNDRPRDIFISVQSVDRQISRYFFKDKEEKSMRGICKSKFYSSLLNILDDNPQNVEYFHIVVKSIKQLVLCNQDLHVNESLICNMDTVTTD